MTRMTSAADSERLALLKRLLRDKITQSEPDRFSTRVNPELGRLLYGAGLDKTFTRGQGSWLWDSDGIRYLDFTGAYGALPFGHNPSQIWTAITEFSDRAEPVFVQPSLLGAAGDLAERLIEVAPDGLDRVTFANSGAEAIEVALKIVRSATGRTPVLTTENGFHGKTLGALSATGRTKYQTDFGAPVAGFDRVPFGDADALEKALANRAGAQQYAAFIVEPVQGEGGVHEAPPGYLPEVARVCSEYGVLLVLDEIQTGLGRTGTLFACEHEGVTPDVMTLAKALGGGVVPAAAVLSRRELVTEGFALRHSSTFAGNTLSTRVGIRALDLLTCDESALMRQVTANGERLKRGLEEMANRYPHLVSDVRGRGFLLGVELTDDLNAFGDQGLIGSLAQQEGLAMVICSYLLNVEHVRLAPTLFGNRVLRVEPPLTATTDECDLFLAAFDRALAVAAANDAPTLLAPLVRRPAERSRDDVERAQKTAIEIAEAVAATTDDAARPLSSAKPGDYRFGFVVHPLDLDSFADFDPGFASYDRRELERLVDRFDASANVLNPAPFVVGSGRVESGHAAAYGEIIGLPYTARHLMALPSERAVRVVREAVELARDRGAQLVGLGAYSSVVTANASLLSGINVPVTTGNAFTATASVDAVRRATTERGVDLAECRIAVIGAGGAIGHAMARLLAPAAGQLILVGNPAHPDLAIRRLRERAVAVAAAAEPNIDPEAGLAAMLESGRLELTTDTDGAVKRAQIVIAATSSPGTVIVPSSLLPGAIVCDVAQPPNVPAETVEQRPDVTLFDGGIIRMPEGRGLGVRYGLPDGYTYACMAETMLLSLANEPKLASANDRLSDHSMLRLSDLARLHEFQLAESRTWRSHRVRPEVSDVDEA